MVHATGPGGPPQRGARLEDGEKVEVRGKLRLAELTCAQALVTMTKVVPAPVRAGAARGEVDGRGLCGETRKARERPEPSR
jgi:hypothetical protein